VTRSRRRLLGSVGARLTVAFVAVALGTLGVFAALVMYEASRDVADLAREEQDATAAAVAEAAGAAYTEAGGWTGADLDAVFALSRGARGEVTVLDESGTPVAGTQSDSSPVRAITGDVVVNGRRVGAVQVAFSSSSLPTPARHLRDALGTTGSRGP
jgi:hypothetical protein